MARYFTHAEAQRMLPQVERLVRDALLHKAEFHQTEEELRRTQAQISMAGGTLVNIARVQSTRNRRDRSVAALKQALEGIQETGALVKDLDIGLIDFMTLYQNREVCLCWKLGEDAIRFWHGPEEGFRGRKPIDDRFLAAHRGDPAH